MNGINLYREILKGKWFIHYSYALSLAPLAERLFAHKSMDDSRDWDGVQTENLEGMEGRAKFPVMAGSSAKTVNFYEDFEKAPSGSVAIIPMKSVMVKYGNMCQYGTEEIASFMLKAGESNNIDAIVLDIDSGGGSVDSIPPMLEAIRRIRADHKKAIVACADLCASAAYYVASHCDQVVAGNNISSEFGSIGVMMSFWDLIPAYEKAGYKFHKIYAPESNYKNLPFEKALKEDYDLIKEEELSPLAIKFQNDVKNARGNKLNLQVPGLLNGRMFYASNDKDPALDAKSVGLIDSIGTLDFSIMLAQSLSEARKYNLY